MGSTFDLRTLRAVRVLRPLKLVSGIPSKCFVSMLISDPSIQTMSHSSPMNKIWTNLNFTASCNFFLIFCIFFVIKKWLPIEELLDKLTSLLLIYWLTFNNIDLTFITFYFWFVLKSTQAIPCLLFICLSCTESSRPAGGAQVHYEGYDPPAADWSPLICGHPHVCNHRPGVLHGTVPQDLLWWCYK